MSPAGVLLLLFQAEVVGENIGNGVMKLIGAVLALVAAAGGLLLFLWLVRRIDKKVNK